jgi:hypothetical protein
MQQDFPEEFLDAYPFLTKLVFDGREYVGIIQSKTKNIVSIYAINNMSSRTLVEAFLTMGQEWWSESNRRVPADLFIGERFKVFQPYVKTFNAKAVVHVRGPMIVLSETLRVKTRRRIVEFVPQPKPPAVLRPES